MKMLPLASMPIPMPESCVSALTNILYQISALLVEYRARKESGAWPVVTCHCPSPNTGTPATAPVSSTSPVAASTATASPWQPTGPMMDWPPICLAQSNPPDEPDSFRRNASLTPAVNVVYVLVPNEAV